MLRRTRPPEFRGRTVRALWPKEGRARSVFRRRVNTQRSLPSKDATVVLLFNLVPTGQIKLRRIATVLPQPEHVASGHFPDRLVVRCARTRRGPRDAAAGRVHLRGGHSPGLPPHLRIPEIVTDEIAGPTCKASDPGLSTRSRSVNNRVRLDPPPPL